MAPSLRKEKFGTRSLGGTPTTKLCTLKSMHAGARCTPGVSARAVAQVSLFGSKRQNKKQEKETQKREKTKKKKKTRGESGVMYVVGGALESRNGTHQRVEKKKKKKLADCRSRRRVRIKKSVLKSTWSSPEQVTGGS